MINLRRLARLPQIPKFNPCLGTNEQKYLNNSNVQQAIHVKSMNWSPCNNFINENWNKISFDDDMINYHEWLINNAPELRKLIFSGDDDSVCSAFGTQTYIWKLSAVEKEWSQWK